MAITNTLLTNLDEAISPTAIDVDNREIAITVIFFCNLNSRDPLDDSVGREFINVYAVQDGDSPSNTNKIVSILPLDAGDTFTFNAERMILNPGDRIYASATNSNAVSATLSYVKV